MPSKGIPELYIYGDIGLSDENSTKAFVTSLGKLKNSKAKAINVHINSTGGNAFDGIAMYQQLKICGMIVNTYIDGVAASAASIIAMAGTKRYIAKSAKIMIHEASTGAWGNAELLRGQAELLESLKDSSASIYATATGKPKEEVMEWMKPGAETWFDADQSLAAGLVDEIVEDTLNIDLPTQQHFSSEAAKMYLQFQPINNSNMEEFESLLASNGLPKTSPAEFISQYKQMQSDIAEMKKKANEQAVKAATAIVMSAIEEGRIAEESKAYFIKFASDQPSMCIETINALPKPKKEVVKNESAHDWIKNSKPTNHSGGSHGKQQEYPDFDEVFKAGKLPTMQKENPEAFKAIYKAKFGVEPKP